MCHFDHLFKLMAPPLLPLLLWYACVLACCPHQVVIMGDGQATQNDFVVKPNVRKVRALAGIVCNTAGCVTQSAR